MNKAMISLILGMGLGILIGYNNEDEIHDLCHRGKRVKKQMMRQFHDAQHYFE